MLPVAEKNLYAHVVSRPWTCPRASCHHRQGHAEVQTETDDIIRELALAKLLAQIGENRRVAASPPSPIMILQQAFDAQTSHQALPQVWVEAAAALIGPLPKDGVTTKPLDPLAFCPASSASRRTMPY